MNNDHFRDAMKHILEQMRRDAEKSDRRFHGDYRGTMPEHAQQASSRPLIVVKHKGGPIT